MVNLYSSSILWYNDRCHMVTDLHRQRLVKTVMNATKQGYKPMTNKQKNLLGKTRTQENPYAIFSGIGPFGNTEVKLLKTYQKPDKELTNVYARWQVAVSSDFTFGSSDIGDSYLKDVIRGLVITYASNEFKENYYLDLAKLIDYSGFFMTEQESINDYEEG
jgi:hypothetical protein